MNKRDALRLKPGDLIVYEVPSAKVWDRYGGEAEVLTVTPNGGILVKDFHYDEEGGRRIGPKHWVPYHHIVYARKSSP